MLNPLLELLVNGEMYDVDINSIFEFTYYVNSNGADMWSLDAELAGWDKYGKDFLLPTTTLKVRTGYKSQDQDHTTWKSIIVKKMNGFLDGQRTRVKAGGYCKGGTLETKFEENKVWFDKTLSSITSEIASKCQMSSDFKGGGGSNKFTLALGNRNYGRFIFEDVLTRAGTNYRCFFQDGEKLILSDKPEGDSTVGDQDLNAPIYFTLDPNPVGLPARAVAWGWDKVDSDKNPYRKDIKPNIIPKYASTDIGTPTDDLPETAIPVMSYDQLSVDNIGQQAFTIKGLDIQKFLVSVNVEKYLSTRANSTVSINLKNLDGTPYFSSGKYYCEGVLHKISKAFGYRLYLVLIRRDVK